jgi:hypothetical protein
MAKSPEELHFKMKLIAIGSASRALEYKKRNPKLSDDEIVRMITQQADDIIKECY